MDEIVVGDEGRHWEGDGCAGDEEDWNLKFGRGQGVDAVGK